MSARARSRALLALVWAAFLVRGAFYCGIEPLWEGFDEWAHFAYVQHLADGASIPRRDTPADDDIRASLELAPLSKWAASDAGAGLTHDQFWQLPPDQQRRRLDQLHALSASTGPSPSAPALKVYEAQQPPLYYWILALPYRILKSLPLVRQVLILRLLSVAIASLIVVLAFLVARQALPGGRGFGVLAAILTASLPGLFLDVCRVGNECLSMVLAATLILALFRVTGPALHRHWLLAGAVLGAALLAKAYALAFVPLLVLAAGLAVIRNPGTARRILAGLALALAVAGSIAGWWYWRNWTTTGTLSGEVLDVASAHAGLAAKFDALRHNDWRTVFDTACHTHIWVGGWSYLVVRRWAYRIVESVAVLCAAGLCVAAARAVVRLRHRRRWGSLTARTTILLAMYLAMWGALFYQSLAAFAARKASIGTGWYLDAAIAAEVVLAVTGLTALAGARWAERLYAAIVVAAVALDFYTVHIVLMPYYTGAIRHTASGALPGFHLGALEVPGAAAQMVERLFFSQVLGSSGWMVALWAGYLVATVGLAVGAVRLAWRRPGKP